MLKKTICVILVSAILLVSICACGSSADDIDKNIIGTWMMVYQTQVITYTFNEDGNVVFQNEKSGEKTTARYTYRNNKLKMMGEGISEEPIPIYLSGDVLVAYGSVYELERLYSTENQNEVYGRWKNKAGDEVWYISRDNTITDSMGTYGILQCGDIYVTYFLDDNENTCPLAFTYEDNEITLYVGNIMRKIAVESIGG